MAAAALHRGHILVVDDDRAFRDLMRTLLERAGFEVREAIDGGDAIAAAQLTRPSLVLLDVLLPGISGYEVLRALHETIDEDLAIILMSGERSGRVYRLGDRLRVKAARVDLDERKIAFETVDMPVRRARKRMKARGR